MGGGVDPKPTLNYVDATQWTKYNREPIEMFIETTSDNVNFQWTNTAVANLPGLCWSVIADEGREEEQVFTGSEITRYVRFAKKGLHKIHIYTKQMQSFPLHFIDSIAMLTLKLPEGFTRGNDSTLSLHHIQRIDFPTTFTGNNASYVMRNLLGLNTIIARAMKGGKPGATDSFTHYASQTHITLWAPEGSDYSMWVNNNHLRNTTIKYYKPV